MQFTSVDKETRRGVSREDVELVLASAAGCIRWALDHKVGARFRTRGCSRRRSIIWFCHCVLPMGRWSKLPSHDQ